MYVKMLMERGWFRIVWLLFIVNIDIDVYCGMRSYGGCYLW